MVSAPGTLPGTPGIGTLEIPRHPHELSTSAATNNASPCQARWRMRRTHPGALGVPRFAGLFAPPALIGRFTGPLLSQRAAVDYRQWQRALTPAQASERPGPE